jgi:hypothetical protein
VSTFNPERARELLGIEGALIEEYLDEPRFVNSDRCEWRLEDGLVRCLPKSRANPCEYCARMRVTKDDGTVEIHCVCWD